MPKLSALVAGDKITGARDYQEDAFQIIQRLKDESCELLLMLADGMGGHVGGARASELAVANFEAHFGKADGDIGQRLRKSLDAANMAIDEDATQNPLYAEMGCTLLACLVTGNELHWLSVGDSLLWLLRENEMIRLNEDHSMRPVLQGLVELGRMSAEELAQDPRVNQLRSALTGNDLRMVDQNEEVCELNAGDQVILASDGLETLTVDEIRSICQEYHNPKDAVDALLHAVVVQKRAGQDNTTVLIYRHSATELEEAAVTRRRAPPKNRFLRIFRSLRRKK